MARMIVVDVSKCIGCHTCELMCAVAHSESKTLVGAIAEHPRQKPRVHVEPVGDKSVPMQCRHCDDAPCVSVCPTGALAISGEGEPVLLDSEKCIGCKMCVQACPFGALVVGIDGKGVLKCDLCVERLAQGEEPACVCGCPTGALTFQEVAEASRSKRRRAAQQLVAEQL